LCGVVNSEREESAMSTAQGGTNLTEIRDAVEGAFLTKFEHSQFGLKPSESPFNYSEPSWMEQMKAMAGVLAKAGFPLANIATAARLTHKVAVNDGIQALVKIISDEIEKAKPKPKTRGLWNWIWGRDTSA
jgi:hypothetical protein